jgi:peptidoglycan hydrolase-like protein with peptidoglycan-binding domain
MNKTKARIVASAVIALSAAAGSLMLAAPATAAPSGCVANVYKYKDQGDCVRKLQALLNYKSNRGLLATFPVDGHFGAVTEGRVRKVQHDWWIGADGIVGSGTWGVLCSHTVGHMTNVQKAAGCASL